MNFISWILNLAMKQAEEIWKEASDTTYEYCVHTVRLAQVTIIASVVLLISGVIIGAMGAPAVGEWCLLSCGLIAAVLSTMFWVRTAICVNVAVIASKGANALMEKIPAIAFDEARGQLAWLRGVTTTVSFIGLFAAVFPLWADVRATMVIATAALVLAGYMAAWSDSKGHRTVIATFAVVVLLLNIGKLGITMLPDSVKSYVGSYTDRLAIWREHDETVAAIDNKAAKSAKKIDADLLKKFADERIALKEKAAKECGGNFCSDTDRQRFEELGRLIARLHDGTYWSEKKGKAPASEPSAPPAATPAAPVTKEETTTDSAIAVAPSCTSRPCHLSKEAGKRVFRELDTKYPDL
jgi:hypothetical protein